jgi:hypothetical protein
VPKTLRAAVFGLWAVTFVGSEWCGAQEEEPAPVGDVLPGDDTVPAVEEPLPGEFSLSELPDMGPRGGATSGDRFPITAGWEKKKGFYITDPENQYFLLRINGGIQARYTYAGRSGRDNAVGLTASGLDRSYFELERLRLIFRGHVLHPNLNYLVQIDGDSDGGGGLRLMDGLIVYKAGELLGGDPGALSFGFGQWKPYFLRQEVNSSGKLQMVERSLTTEFFNIDRTVGLFADGYVRPFFYSFAVTNGIDSANRSSAIIDQIPALVGKFDVNVLGDEGGKYEEGNVRCGDEPVWVIGVSGLFDKNNGTEETRLLQPFTVYEFGIDTVFKYSIFSLQAEYVGRFLDYRIGNNVPLMNGDGGSEYAHGMYVQGGVFLVPGVVELTGRVSTVWGTGRRSGNAVEVGPGINWFISRSHDIKIQTDVMYFDISDKVPIQTEALRSPLAGFDPNDLASYTPFISRAAGYGAGQQGVMWRVQFQLRF